MLNKVFTPHLHVHIPPSMLSNIEVETEVLHAKVKTEMSHSHKCSHSVTLETEPRCVPFLLIISTR